MTYTYTPEELDKKVKSYFFEVEERKNSFPDEAGMLNYLDITDEEYEALKADEKYERTFRFALRRRKSWLERQMVADNKKATGCMNALKQPQNGGYTDKPSENKDRKIIVKLERIADT